jgi:IclR family acetate operon transcriptional repressor
MSVQTVRRVERVATRVHSIERTFMLLEAMSQLGGTVRLGQLSTQLGLPIATTHRLVRTLVELGYVHQGPSREYSLGLRLMRLGEHAVQLFGSWSMPYLRELVDSVGESANLAVLDEDRIVYAAQVPGRHTMRMFTEVGLSAPLHCTAAGKAILAQLPPDQAIAAVSASRMQPRTRHTITTAEGMRGELESVRKAGYAVDDEEQEIGVRCIAVAVPGSFAPAALSISGPSPRITDALIERSVPLLRHAAMMVGQLGA